MSGPADQLAAPRAPYRPQSARHPRRRAGVTHGREPDLRARGAQWATTAPTLDPTRLVFLDESGVATNLLVQRCQVHKRRNVLEHLPEVQRPWVLPPSTVATALISF